MKLIISSFAEPDPTFHSGADPDPIFQFDAGPDSTTNFFSRFGPSMLQNDPLRLPAVHFDADPDPDPDPASQNAADLDP